ncbi:MULTISPECIES: helicase-related protein [Moorena]|uniref:Helicase n=2 Tax=Moorena TaxID=1155738 RepID=A0A1D9G3Y2_MOOP1|nr:MULTISPECIES: helicase-related protein [Moorena]AOY82261.1 helicase [Moorena producens JHB]NES41521.1 helicase [Moorena sp. SIO2C4]
MTKIAEDLGRIFEVGFNIGILADIEQNKIKHNFGNLYCQDLQQLKFRNMLQRIVDKLISPLEREMAEKWSTFFLQKGFLSGLNFFRDYLKAIGWSKEHKRRHLEIVYYQCCFCDDNSIGTYCKGDDQWYKEVLSQFDQELGSQTRPSRNTVARVNNFNANNLNSYIREYSKKGEFLKADTLMLLSYRGREFRVLCVDLSVFSIKTDADIENLNYVDILRHGLIRDINYLKSKSVFSKLRLDTKNLDFKFAKELKSYFTAFKFRDKETSKLIQAGSYAHSFNQFLREIGIFSDQTSVVSNVVGYSDRGISAMSVNQTNREVLDTCHEIYKHDSSPKEIKDARHQVLKQIQRNAYRSFQDGKQFVDNLLAIQPDTITKVNHKEHIQGFVNSIAQVPPDLSKQLGLSVGLSTAMNLRDAHGELITKALVSDQTYLFLTGNPGIGKTTAIAKFLKGHVDEGFLFFYVSPRKQVNLDIIEKFKDSATGELCDNQLIAINTNANLISDNFGRYTVQYLWNECQDDFNIKDVDFFDSRTIQPSGRRSNKLKRLTDEEIQDRGKKSKGVLSSICEAIYCLVDEQTSNSIVATVSIQSLKATPRGNTLEHFEKIFRNAYNKGEGLVIPAKMQAISSRIKHLFIMIDEITGDDGGVEFLNGIHRILSNYKLINNGHGFNTKVIVADASIVDPGVIDQHLSDISSEPDKIYFRSVGNSANSGLGLPLSRQRFKFKGLEATVINANSYPASKLSITYKVLVESCRFSEEANLKQQDILGKSLQKTIFQDIQALMNRSDVEQILVYIQDKQRLAQLIDSIRKELGEFTKYQDYLEIHANISEYEKKQIQQYKNQVKVVFMTASGSRGLSFPKAKHILVEIPRFEIEHNLMEVIQVIYRGRGQYEDDGVVKTLDNQDKELIFYLAERSVYYDAEDDQQQQLFIKESVLSLLNILLLLKGSIMTRIQGYGQIGRDNFLIIPIGGKSISAVGNRFSAQIANLIRELKNEYKRKPWDDPLEEVSTKLKDLLNQAEFLVKNTAESNYISLVESFNNQFNQLVNHGLDKLLNLGAIETAYISGALLVVPIANGLQETYQINLVKLVRYITNELLETMGKMSASKSYPENLRSGLKDGIELLETLGNSAPKTQWFEQKSKGFDQYYALPLFTFIAGEALKKYFDSKPEEPEDARFRKIMSSYIRTFYPVDNVLPIGHEYQDFPFIVFNSYSLEQLRAKMFTDKYLLTSNELNVLNLILSR